MDYNFNTIWFDKIDPKNYLLIDLSKEKMNSYDITNLQYLLLTHFKQKNNLLTDFPHSDSLLYLGLNLSNNINFDGIYNFPNLKKLELEYCLKLSNDKGIMSLSESLEYLNINQSKKFIFSEEMLSLHKLKVLRLNSCGPIDNLNFLKYFPNLIEFRFVNTNIINGDLSPIIEHPVIKKVGFLNKRHYNISEKEMDSYLSKKITKPFEEWEYKGEYKTFKYI